MTITCFIEYRIDPNKREQFAEYARQWGDIIPACGGQLLGYFLPWEGTNYQAWGLISFSNLADYEAYRERLRNDADGRANFDFAQRQGFILEERRTFLAPVPESCDWLEAKA